MALTPTREAGFADEVLYVPSEDLTDLSALCARPNARRARKRWSPDSACELYDGHEGLLVRTALIRSTHYDSNAALPTIASADDVARIVEHVGYADQEHIVVLAVNRMNQVVAIYEAAIGPSDHCAIEARTILKIVILTAAVAAIIVHNHPSGNLRPSRDDLHMTKKVVEAMECLGFTLLDHLITSHGKHLSFMEQGLL